MFNKGKKISIIGAGFVGATLANELALKQTAHTIVLSDLYHDIAKGKTLDISHAAAVVNSHSIIKESTQPDGIKDSDIVVITAGSPRKPGMSRDDLLFINAEVISSVIDNIKEYAPNSIIIVVTNPLDVMAYTAFKRSNFSKNRVIGMAGILDSGRMSSFIYDRLGYGSGQIHATVLGGHGDEMVPLVKHTTVAGVCIDEIMTEDEIQDVIQKTKNAGAEVVKYLKTGSAYYAPAKAAALMCEAIINDSKQIYPCSTLLYGEYGFSDVYTGVPVVLGATGVEKIIELKLSLKEQNELEKSVNGVKSMIKTLQNKNFI